jgi:hypothetical protein
MLSVTQYYLKPHETRYAHVLDYLQYTGTSHKHNLLPCASFLGPASRSSGYAFAQQTAAGSTC